MTKQQRLEYLKQRFAELDNMEVKPIMNATIHDVIEEIDHLETFKEFNREHFNDNLTSDQT